MTAPPNWPKPGKGHNDPSSTVNWIKTWKKAGA
jgi:branched-chain amino acid transport system substrate-binding protein